MHKLVLCMAIVISAVVFDNYYSTLNISTSAQLEDLIQQTKKNNHSNKNNEIEFCNLNLNCVIKTTQVGKDLQKTHNNITNNNQTLLHNNIMQLHYFMKAENKVEKIIYRNHFFCFNTHNKSISSDDPSA